MMGFGISLHRELGWLLVNKFGMASKRVCLGEPEPLQGRLQITPINSWIESLATTHRQQPVRRVCHKLLFAVAVAVASPATETFSADATMGVVQAQSTQIKLNLISDLIRCERAWKTTNRLWLLLRRPPGHRSRKEDRR